MKNTTKKIILEEPKTIFVLQWAVRHKTCKRRKIGYNVQSLNRLRSAKEKQEIFERVVNKIRGRV